MYGCHILVITNNTLHLFQIFRPICAADQKYCASSKSCIASSAACIPLQQRKCAADEIFCIFRKQCLPNTQDSMKTCTPYSPYKFSVPPADYELIYKFRVEIKTLGHHIEFVPTPQEPYVKKGDVLGIGLDSAELGYKEVTVNQGVTFHYTSSVPNVGDKLLRSSNPSTIQKRFIFAAHFAHEAKFVIRDKFASTGIKYVTSNITETRLVTIDYPIANVSFVFRKIANTNDSIVFKVQEHPGSNTTYIWDFGNGESLRTQLLQITYAYPAAGGFIVKLTAENSVNSATVSKPIFIYDPILNFKFSECPVKAKALGETTTIKWESERGTNMTYVVDFGDSSERYSVVTTGADSRKGQTTHRYGALGNYTVTIYGYNLVGPNKSIECHAIVETPLVGLVFSVPVPHVTPNIYLAEGDVMKVDRHFKEGTNIRCSYDFKDGTPRLITHEVTASHKYTSAGQYKVDVTCYNDISSISATLNATVIVEELKALSGLSLAGPPTRITTASSLTLQMQQGTTYFCDWEFGDGTSLKTDASHTGKAMIHTYSAIDTYNVVVTCTNRLGHVTTRANVPVDSPVKTVTISSDKRYVRVKQKVYFDVTVQEGSRLLYEVRFGDGKVFKLQRNASGLAVAGKERFSHEYDDDGSYTVDVTVSNALGKVVETLKETIIVQYPVENAIFESDSPISLSKGLASFYISFPSNVTPPTNAFCVWYFNDGTPASSPEQMKLKPDRRTHKYTSAETFVVSVNVSNQVSFKILQTRIRVQKIKDVSILPLRKINEKTAPGFGPQKNFFLVDEVVVFNATTQDNDINYYYDFGDQSKSNRSVVPWASHAYKKEGEYTVTVFVKNVLGELKSTKVITIQQPVGKVSVISNYPSYFTDPTKFYVSINTRGSDSCLLLSLGDNRGVYFGSEPCRPKVFRSNETFIRIAPDMLGINYTHTYANMGNYTAIATAWNYVSRTKDSSIVMINNYPCLRPNVRIDSDGTKTMPKKIQKSDALVLNIKLDYNCPVARTIIFTWKAYEVRPLENFS